MVEADQLRALEKAISLPDTIWTAGYRTMVSGRTRGDAAGARAAHDAANRFNDADRRNPCRYQAPCMRTADPQTANDADYVFITFILRYLPHGIIGLLVAAFFAAALSSKAGELNALGSTTTVDFYRHVMRREADDAHYVRASKCFTAAWGFVAIGFALFVQLAENLIQAVNILGSILNGVVLGIFCIAFFLPSGSGHGGFWGALAAQGLVIGYYCQLPISYLWYNVIGCAACIVISLGIQQIASSATGSLHMSSPRICFGQQPCGFFPRRFLYAKIVTARRLQREIGGEIVFFCHDSDHDPRETQTILTHRQTSRDHAAQLRLCQQNPAQVVAAFPQARLPDWHANTVRQLPAYVDPALG